MKVKLPFIGNIFAKNITLARVLQRALGRRRFKYLELSCHDWREMVSLATTLYFITEDQLYDYISEKLRLPFIKRIPALDLEDLPENLNISDLRRMGCMPFFRNKTLSGVICLDPQRARMLFADYTNITFALSSWTLISKALNESENNYVVRLQAIQEKERLHSIEAAKQALLLVIKQVENFSISNFIIDLTNSNKITYCFKTKEDKKAEGTINHKIFNSLSEILAEFSKSTIANLQIGDIEQFYLKVEKKSLESIFEIEIRPCTEKITSQAALSSASNNQAKIILFPEAISIESKIDKNYIEQDEGSDSTAVLALIVEDNLCFAKVLERFFHKQQIDSVHAANGHDGLQKLSEIKKLPNVIICDLHMPEMNGVEFIRRLRSEVRFQNIPVVILTSENDLEMELQLLTDGADIFISKSDDPRLLGAKVKRLIEYARRKAA